MGRYSVVLFFFFVFLTPIFATGQTRINVSDFGANGNDRLNDWEAIQRAIDFACKNGGGEIYLPNGTYYVKDQTLVIWGKNIRFVGESKVKTIIVREGKLGWWGELLSISGKYNGGKYQGGMGKTSYQRFSIYQGASIPSENILVSNLTFTSNLNFPAQSNNIGVVNSKNVKIENCIVKNAPQSNVAIVNITDKAANSGIVLINCSFENPGQHNVRVISYNQGKFKGNSVELKSCIFRNVQRPDRAKEIQGKLVHLWYRAGLGNENISLIVDNCYFDNTGEIVGTVNVNNFILKNSEVRGKINLISNSRYKSRVTIQNNRIEGSPSKAISIKNATTVIQGNQSIN